VTRIRLARFRLRARRAELADVARRHPGDGAARRAAADRVAEAAAALPWWLRIGC